MDERRLLTAKEAAAYLRISLFTLRKIEQQGLIVPYRTPGGHRRYSIDMLNRACVSRAALRRRAGLF